MERGLRCCAPFMRPDDDMDARFSDLRSRIQKAFTQGVGQQLSDGMRVNLTHEIGPMIIDGFQTEPKTRGDLLIGATRRDQAQNLPLARGQLDIGLLLLEQRENVGRNDLGAAQNQLESIGQMLRIAALHEQSIHARGNQFAQKPNGRETGEHHDARLGTPPAHFTEYLDPLGIGHRDVECQEAGLVLAHETDGLDPICRLGNDRHVSYRAHYVSYPGAQKGMIVGDNRRNVLGRG